MTSQYMTSQYMTSQYSHHNIWHHENIIHVIFTLTFWLPVVLIYCCHPGCSYSWSPALISERTPVMRNRLLATISKLNQQYSLHVEYILPKGADLRERWHNIFHATTGSSLGCYGCRTPSIWIRNKNGSYYVMIIYAVNGNPNYQSNHVPFQLN